MAALIRQFALHRAAQIGCSKAALGVCFAKERHKPSKSLCSFSISFRRFLFATACLFDFEPFVWFRIKIPCIKARLKACFRALYQGIIPQTPPIFHLKCHRLNGALIIGLKRGFADCYNRPVLGICKGRVHRQKARQHQRDIKRLFGETDHRLSFTFNEMIHRPAPCSKRKL